MKSQKLVIALSLLISSVTFAAGEGHTHEHLPNHQLFAPSRVELFLLLDSPRRGVKKNGAF